MRQTVDGAGNCSGFGKGVDSQGNQVQWRLFVASTGVCQTDIRRHESQNFCHQGVAVQIPARKKAMSDITISELANATGLSAADERKDANLVRRAGSDNGGDWVNANHRIYINAVVRL